MAIVDIQLPVEFQKYHFKGALETGAYPVKSLEDKEKLGKVMPRLLASQKDVVIVCPRGGGGAKNTYDYLKPNIKGARTQKCRPLFVHHRLTSAPNLNDTNIRWHFNTLSCAEKTLYLIAKNEKKSYLCQRKADGHVGELGWGQTRGVANSTLSHYHLAPIPTLTLPLKGRGF